MKAILISWTEKPILTMMYAFMNMHNELPDSLDEFEMEMLEKHGPNEWRLIAEEFVDMLASNPHNSVLEYVNTNWMIKEASRAFQQQLTRTRLAAYSAQSLRIVRVEDFATRRNYTTPDGVLDNPSAEDEFVGAMMDSQVRYNRLVSMGAKTEDARGVLPLNIHSPITMSINLRSLSHTMASRTCFLAQGEIRKFSDQVVEEVNKKLGKEFAPLFQKPCDRIGRCPMPINCGKTKYKLEERYRKMHIDAWLKG